jgi:hypothetical protein
MHEVPCPEARAGTRPIRDLAMPEDAGEGVTGGREGEVTART